MANGANPPLPALRGNRGRRRETIPLGRKTITALKVFLPRGA